MHYVQLYEFSISNDTVNQISLSQSNFKEKSNMLSYTTERPVIIYRIEIIAGGKPPL